MLEPVFEAMKPYFMEHYGNPASLHQFGLDAEDAVTESRETLAGILGANPEEIVFTGSATESNNTAIFGVANEAPENKRHIIVSKVEHHAVLNVMKLLDKKDFDVTFLNVNREGFVDPDDLKKAIRPDTLLFSVVHGNHVIGTIQDLKALGEVCREHGVIFHTDAAQSFGKIPINVQELPVDLISMNAHKMHGPKGVGALYMRRGVKVGRLMEGGPQENNRRPGTENVPAIVGMAKAAEIAAANMEKDNAYMIKLRDRLIDKLLEIPNTHINGPRSENRMPNNANITFLYIEGEAILMHLSMRGVYVSSGSACSSIALMPSNVLTAIGLKHEEAHGSIRFSFSKLNTEEEVDQAVEHMKAVADQLRAMSAFVPSKHSELTGEGHTYYKKKKGEL